MGDELRQLSKDISGGWWGIDHTKYLHSERGDITMNTSQLLSQGLENFPYYYVLTILEEDEMKLLTKDGIFHAIDEEYISCFLGSVGGVSTRVLGRFIYPFSAKQFGNSYQFLSRNPKFDSGYLIELKIPKSSGLIVNTSFYTGKTIQIEDAQFYKAVRNAIDRTDTDIACNFDCKELKSDWIISIYRPTDVEHPDGEKFSDCILYTPIYKTQLSFSQNPIRIAGDGYGEKKYSDFLLDTWVDSEPWWFNLVRCKPLVYRKGLHRILKSIYGDSIPLENSQEFTDILDRTSKVIYNDISV